MTITLQAVNELIASLENAGELSIREQKFLKLAKAFKQLAAENVALKEKLNKLDVWPGIEFYSSSWEFNNNDGIEAIKFMFDIETPATDRIVAGIKADGVEEFAKHCDDSIGFVEPEDEELYTLMEERAREFAKQLREGADK
ncbi:Uncharacterised protein [Klebsiella pneumoniae]|uniref:hypothetical protein n=1 Tax=Klebsiella pneumoniae TaxID=573 RepID=UPI000DE64D8A|nr:hypothetical protein [Klebsiella pneumoniae]SSG03832.1 Uncharacterised protein [Klebsiella pneumoniae]